MGKETAFALIKEGHIVYGAARRVDKMQDLVAAGGHAREMDVTDHEAVTRVVEQIMNDNGRIERMR